MRQVLPVEDIFLEVHGWLIINIIHYNPKSTPFYFPQRNRHELNKYNTTKQLISEDAIIILY